MNFNEGSHRSYQRLECFFKRHFSEEICDALRIAEPCVVVGQSYDHAFKFVVLTDDTLYFLANPPKTESDIELSVELQHINYINQVHDIPDFLSGELKKNAQHLALSWSKPKQTRLTQSKTSIWQSKSSPRTDSRDANKRSLRMSSNHDRITGRVRSASFESKDTSHQHSVQHESGPKKNTKSSIRFNLEETDPQGDLKTPSDYSSSTHSLPRATSYAASIPLKLSGSENNLKGLCHARTSSDTKLNNSPTFSRPLPPPLLGTETSNASIVINSVNPKRSGRQRRIQSERKATHLRANSSMVHSSSDSQLSKNEANLKIENHLQEYSPEPAKPIILPSKARQDNPIINTISSSKLMQSNSSSSSGLNRSFSERLGNLFGKSSGRNSPKELGSSLHPTESKNSNPSLLREEVDHDELPEDLYEEFTIDIYLLNGDSHFIPLLKSTNINSIMRITEEMEIYRDKTGIVFSSRVLEEFYQLKTDLLKCTNIEQAFILTKELLVGSKGSLNLKNLFWKTPELIQYYVNTLNAYLIEQDKIVVHGDRADELDYMLVVADLISNMLFNTEICPPRNKLMFGQRGALVYKLVRLVLIKPDLPSRRKTNILSPAAALLLAGVENPESESEKEKELAYLLDEWTDASSCLLYELLRATEQRKWAFQDGKGLTLRSLIDIMEKHANIEHHLNEIIDGMMRRLLQGRAVLKYSVAILLFKQFSLLRFVFDNSPSLLRHVADHYYEEFRYYIGSPNALNRIPECPISSNLLQIIHDVTAMVINNH